MICEPCGQAGDLASGIRARMTRTEEAYGLRDWLRAEAKKLHEKCVDCACHHHVPEEE